MRLNTPAGKPASATRSASRSAVSGVCSAGLRTTVQPAASAGRDLLHRHHQREVPRHDLRARRRPARAGHRRGTCPPGRCEGSTWSRRSAWSPSRPCSAASGPSAGISRPRRRALGLPLSIDFELGQLVGVALDQIGELHRIIRSRSYGGRPVQRPSSNAVRAAATARSTSASVASTIARDLAPGRGIVDGDRLVAGRIDPVAVDEQLRLALEQRRDRLAIGGLGGDAGHLVHGAESPLLPSIAPSNEQSSAPSRPALPWSSGRGGTASPRWTAGRAAIASSQRWRWSSPSIVTPGHSWIRAQQKLAMSAIE